MTPSATASLVSANSGSQRQCQSPSLLDQPDPIMHQNVMSLPFSTTSTSNMSPVGPSLSTTPAFTSLQSSPEGPRGRNRPFSHPPTPLQLPEPIEPVPIPFNPSAMSEAVALNKGDGLMRRISRGAANKLARRRQSSNHVANRDRSSGPVVMRRRSDSKTGVELDTGFFGTGSGPEGDDYNVPDDLVSLHGLGLSGEGIPFSSGRQTPEVQRAQEGIAPTVPQSLQVGTQLWKVTKRKKRKLRFILDTDSAKVSWDASNMSKRFYIDDIQEIRLQSDARNYREEFQASTEEEQRWFTIIYTDRNRAKSPPDKSIHLIAPDQHTFELWTSTLNHLFRYRRGLMVGLAGSGQDEKILRGHWNLEMAKFFNGAPHADDEECLGFPEVESFCRSLHLNCSQNLFRAHFSKVDADGSGYLNFSGFKDFVRRLKERKDIKEIYQAVKSEAPQGLNLSWFLDFLRDTQGMEVESNRAQWVKVFTKFARNSNCSFTTHEAFNESLLQMDFAAFSHFLSSTHNSILSLQAPQKPLDRPLNEYFISSSHNTYLLGRQVNGKSSTEPYIRALQKGCRCVEIDCWDGPDGRPIVLHGRTMTSSVLFSDCISAIGKHAFTESPYPLIMSLEVHCNDEQQQVMVDIMIQTLGEWLVRVPYMTNATALPSPEDLHHRILIKVKAGGDSTVSAELPMGRRDRSFSSPFSRPQILDNSVIPNGPVLSSPPSMSPSEQGSLRMGARSSTAATSMSSATDESDAAHVGTPSRTQPPKRKSKIIKSLGDLGVYARGLKFNDFSSAESKTYNHIFSFAERRLEALCRDPETKVELENHNMHHLMRIYPSGFRVKSTNPDPLAFWRRGAQMVALNWQTYDLGMQINEAMFACGSDRLGYVLKPQELRPADPLQEPTRESASLGVGKIHRKLVKFSVDIISAQQLPQPRGTRPGETLDPYIEIEMFSADDKAKGVASGKGGQDASARNGMSGIGSPHRRRTHVVPSNGYNPVFDESFNLSLETKYPDLVFVRWSVWDSQDGHNYNNNANSEPLATFVAKLSSLEQGYRHLPLHDCNGDLFVFATLFCKVKKEEPIIIEKEDPVAEKVGRFGKIGHFGHSVFKRTLSVEKKPSKDGIKSKKSANKSSKDD